VSAALVLIPTSGLAISMQLEMADPMGFARQIDSPKRRAPQIKPVGVASNHHSRRMPGDGRGGSAKKES
jgi:hypothetical protein